MKLIHSGFDTLTYAIKGAAEPYSLERMKLAQEKAKQEQRDMPISFTKGQLKGLIAPTGCPSSYKMSQIRAQAKRDFAHHFG